MKKNKITALKEKQTRCIDKNLMKWTLGNRRATAINFNKFNQMV